MPYPKPHTPRAIFLSYSGLTREEVKTFIDAMEDVPYWYAALPNAFFLVSAVSPRELSMRLVTKFGGKPSFFLTPLDAQEVAGWLPPHAWHIIRNPQNPRQD